MRVIVADDAVLFREGLARVLTDAEFEVTTVGDARALLEQVRWRLGLHRRPTSN